MVRRMTRHHDRPELEEVDSAHVTRELLVRSGDGRGAGTWGFAGHHLDRGEGLLVAAHWPAIDGTLGSDQDACPERSIVTFTASFLPRQAASAGKLIEDARQKVVGAARRPVRVAVSTVTVPIEVGRTSFNILRLTEELLEEVVFLLRSMRPVVGAVSNAQQTDNFDTVFRKLEQIQNTARAPIGVVRSVLAPVRPSPGVDPPVIEVEPVQTPGVVRIASITVTMPRITVGNASRSPSMPD